MLRSFKMPTHIFVRLAFLTAAITAFAVLSEPRGRADVPMNSLKDLRRVFSASGDGQEVAREIQGRGFLYISVDPRMELDTDGSPRMKYQMATLDQWGAHNHCIFFVSLVGGKVTLSWQTSLMGPEVTQLCKNTDTALSPYDPNKPSVVPVLESMFNSVLIENKYGSLETVVIENVTQIVSPAPEFPTFTIKIMRPKVERFGIAATNSQPSPIDWVITH